MKLGRSVYHVEIPAFDESEFSHPPQELLKISNDNIRFAVPQPSNKRPLFCLRLYRKRPCSRNGTNKADKFPSCHGNYSPSREPPSCKSNTNMEQQPCTASRQNRQVHVRFGSEADISTDHLNVRCTADISWS